jgi:hypothetical protein
MTDEHSARTGETQSIDLQQVERLVSALEADSPRCAAAHKTCNAALESILKRLLDSSAPHHAPVSEGLRRIHALMDELVEDAIQGARYVAEIGRILGM